MKMRITVLVFVIVMVFGGITVCAAPKQMPDGSVFDPEFYAATYPDVKAAFGTDEALLYKHYIEHGRTEGRLPFAPVQTETIDSATVATTQQTSTPAFYTQQTAELNQQVHALAMGNAFANYSPVVNGIDFSNVFAPATYYVYNPDVAKSIGADGNALLRHYIAHGSKEGRIAKLVTVSNPNQPIGMPTESIYNTMFENGVPITIVIPTIIQSRSGKAQSLGIDAGIYETGALKGSIKVSLKYETLVMGNKRTHVAFYIKAYDSNGMEIGSSIVLGRNVGQIETKTTYLPAGTAIIKLVSD